MADTIFSWCAPKRARDAPPLATPSSDGGRRPPSRPPAGSPSQGHPLRVVPKGRDPRRSRRRRRCAGTRGDEPGAAARRPPERHPAQAQGERARGQHQDARGVHRGKRGEDRGAGRTQGAPSPRGREHPRARSARRPRATRVVAAFGSPRPRDEFSSSIARIDATKLLFTLRSPPPLILARRRTTRRARKSWRP